MKIEWFWEASPWRIATERIRKRTLGRIVEICIQEIVEADSDTALNHRLRHWKRELTTLLGPIQTQSRLKARNSLSALWCHRSGTIVRWFADTATMGSTGGLSFEVIGTEESLLFRTPGALASIQIAAGGGRFDTCQIQQVAPAEQLADWPAFGRRVRLGILTFEHPHAAGNHVPALRHLGRMIDVAAIADPERRRCAPWLKTFGARYYSTSAELLADASIDAVLVTTENWRHATNTIAAAQAGKDVLCDKPIATTLADAAAMVRACQENRVRFVTTFPCRFHPAIEQLKQRIGRGELGRIQAIMATNHGCMYQPFVPAWVRDPQRNGGGCIIDHTVHVADLMRYLTGQEFTSVRTFAASALQVIPAEDIAVSHGWLSGGTLYQIDSSWSRKAHDPCWGDVTMRIVGSRGSASLDLYNNHQVLAYTAHGVECHYPNHLTHQHGMIFVDYCRARHRRQHGENADGVDGLRTLELVFASYDAWRQNRAVPIRQIGISR